MTATNQYYPHVSVDCVVFGFDGERLRVILMERSFSASQLSYNDKKLPGSIIHEQEDIDAAAFRVLQELTGLKNIYLSQFHAFGSPNRTADPRDVLWLEKTTQLKIGRIVTIAYVALVKINRKIQFSAPGTTAHWHDVADIRKMSLAFDHQRIIEKGLEHIKHRMSLEPHLMFELLPAKFSMSQLRTLHDVLFQTRSDVRNFHKKVAQWPFVVMLDELEVGVPHRAARLYKFDRKKNPSLRI